MENTAAESQTSPATPAGVSTLEYAASPHRTLYHSSSSALDLDLEKLALIIEEQHSGTKRALLAFGMELKSKLVREGLDAVENERLQSQEHSKSKQAEMEALKEDLAKAHASGHRSIVLLHRLAIAFCQAKHCAQQNRLLALVVYGWRNWTKRQQRIQDHLKHAVFFYDSRKVKRHILDKWRSWAKTEGKATLKKRHVEMVEAARAEARAESAVRLAALEATVAEAQAALAREQELRTRLEEDMRRAFMRGVCALNLEAMNMMKRGVPPHGHNPFPVPVFSKPGDASGVVGPAGVPTAAEAPSVAADQQLSTALAEEMVTGRARDSCDTEVYGTGSPLARHDLGDEVRRVEQLPAEPPAAPSPGEEPAGQPKMPESPLEHEPEWVTFDVLPAAAEQAMMLRVIRTRPANTAGSSLLSGAPTPTNTPATYRGRGIDRPSTAPSTPAADSPGRPHPFQQRRPGTAGLASGPAAVGRSSAMAASGDAPQPRKAPPSPLRRRHPPSGLSHSKS